MLNGCLPETENKRICQISGLKSGRGRFRNLRWLLKRELWEQYLTERQNGCLRSGRLREVVAMRELTVLEFLEGQNLNIICLNFATLLNLAPLLRLLR